MSENPPLSLRYSDGFPAWLDSLSGSIAFTTYQAGKLFTVGINAQSSKLSVFERSVPKCMGLCVEDVEGSVRLWVSSLVQLWRYENFLDKGSSTDDGYDAVFVPLSGHTTGEIDIHDIQPMPGHGNPVFVATRFNCLATLDPHHSFQPVWVPDFVSQIVAEDRCHLNGLAMRRGRPGFATCVATTNTAGGWRDHRRDGGVVMDVESREVVCAGLSMPHSPRWHGDRLFVLQSGSGEFGQVDLGTGAFEPICFLPGFARGIAMTGSHAVIGVSRPRREAAFEGLQLDERLVQAGQQAQCMIAVVDLTSGEIAHALMIDGVVRELYDVAIIPRVRRPKLLGLVTPEIRYQVRPASMG